MKKLILLNFFVLSVLCYSDVFSKVRIDQLPMYGDMDRNEYPQLKKADEELILGTTTEFGSREKASEIFTDYAFRLYQQGDNEKAMARFNQAWIINPNNPEVYWGFSAILHDRGEYCKGFQILELGLTKGSLESGYKPDLAVLYAGCAMHKEKITENERSQYFKKSSEIFVEAENDSSVPKPYLYFQWIRTLNARGDYALAWEKVQKYRLVSNSPLDKKLLKKLSENMEEPK